MHALLSRLVILTLLASMPLLAQVPAAANPTINPATSSIPMKDPDPNPIPTNPSARTEPWWVARHKAKIEEVKKNGKSIELVMIGDSITQNYEKTNSDPAQNILPVWQQYFVPRHALNLGFSGDRTQEVLWRIENGEVDGLAPRNIVLLIGTNNTFRKEPADAVSAGIIAVAEELHRRMPAAKITLIGILPHGAAASITAADTAINASVSVHYAGSSYVHTLDLTSLFVVDGVLQNNLYYDATPTHAGHHPNADGMRKMAQATIISLGEIPPPWAIGRDKVTPQQIPYGKAKTPTPVGLYVAMGDSITYGYGTKPNCQAFPVHPVDIDEFCPDGRSYAVLIARQLRAAGVAGHFMNVGINGATIKRIMQDELPYLPSDATLVTLYIGTNDSRGVARWPVDNVVRVYEKGYDELLEAIRARAPHVRIVLINFPNEKYLAASYHVEDSVLPLYDEVSQRLARFIDSHFSKYAVVDTICDPHSYDDSLRYNASVHPNEAGAKFLADAALKVILNAHPTPPPASCKWLDSQPPN